MSDIEYESEIEDNQTESEIEDDQTEEEVYDQEPCSFFLKNGYCVDCSDNNPYYKEWTRDNEDEYDDDE